MHGFSRRGAVVAALVVGALVSAPLSAAGVTPTPTDSVAPTAVVSPASTKTDPTNRASAIIVKYRDGLITPMDAKGRPFGWNSAVTVPVVGGADIAEGMTTFELAQTVDLATARKVANELALNPAIEWAEPEGWRQIVADVAPMAETPVDVTVSGTTGSATKTGAFTYSNTAPANPPTVSSLDVTQGPAAGGTRVTVTGTNLTGATSITVGGTAAPLGTITSTTVAFTTPAKTAGTYSVAVTTPGGTATLESAYTYLAAPTLLASPLSRTTGSTEGGQTVTISGANLADTSSVTFGGSAAKISSASSSQVVVTTPRRLSAGAVRVVVTTPGGSVTAATQFTYSAPATVSSISPTTGATGGGTSVTLSGTNLLSTSSVTVDGVSASITSTTPTKVVFTTPAHAAGTVDIVVTGPAGSVTKASSFTYVILPPALTSLTPRTGSTDGGTLVRLSGSRLGDVTTVTFGGTTATIQSQTATTIQVVAPAKSTGAVSVVATGPGGPATLTNAFTYFAPPFISSASPSAVPLAGSVVTISGTGMTGATGVTVGGTAGTAFRVISASQVSFTAPAKTAGSFDIVVTGPGGSNTLAGGLTYVAAPTLTSSPLSQTVGSSGGGQTVTITGTNLALTSSVSFGGTAATISSRSATQVVVQTPARAASTTPVTLVVTTPGGTVTKLSAFTYAAPATVSTVSPATGGSGGGVNVTLTGTNLQYATRVTFDGVAATVVSKTATSVVVRTPMHAVGVVDVVVTSSTGAVPKSNGFTYVLAVPTLATTMSPAKGTIDGGASVTLTGSNLGDVTQVTFGGVDAQVISQTETRIVVSTPARLSAGAVSVLAIGPGGTSASRAFTYVADPVISSVSPNVGRLTGGTSVTITGKRLTGTTSVKLGTALTTAIAVSSANITNVSDTEIRILTPAGTAGAKTIFLTSSSGSTTLASGYTYSATATTSVPKAADGASRPEVGPAVATPPGVDQISSKFLPRVAPQSSITPQVTACADSSATVRIQRCYDDSDNDFGSFTSYGQLAYSDFYVTTAARSTLVADVVPLGGVVSSTWLTGANNDVYVLFDVNNDQQEDVAIVAPGVSLAAGASVAAIVEDSPDGGYTWSYRDGSSPTHTACSATLTRQSGTHSYSAATSWWQFTVDWNCLFGANATAVDGTMCLSDNALYCDWSPDTFTGNVMNLPTALADPPTITTVSPNIGVTTGGTSVTITGTNLSDMTTVTFGGVEGTITSKSATTIVVTTPPQSSMVTPTEAAYTNGTLWGLTNPTYGIKASTAWAKTQGNPNVVVAILDTGITNHPDLGTRVAGYDMVSDATSSNDGDGRDADPTDPGDWCPSDAIPESSWHGTHVSGTVNAAINGIGSVGVAPNVKVEPVRVLGQCGGTTTDIVAGIIWAAGGSVAGIPPNANPANVISMSLGGGGACSASEQAAINFATSRGVTVVVAAGNDNADATNYSPASCNGVITVAATDSLGKRASFSNFGSKVEIAAPGVDIYSTVNLGATTPGGFGYASWNGTSMATPHVAGVVALMLSRDPTLTPDQVIARIQSTKSAFGGSGGLCDPVTPSKTCGVGIINAGAAVQ